MYLAAHWAEAGCLKTEADTFYRHVLRGPMLHSYIKQSPYTPNATVGDSKSFWSLLSTALLEQPLGF